MATIQPFIHSKCNSTFIHKTGKVTKGNIFYCEPCKVDVRFCGNCHGELHLENERESIYHCDPCGEWKKLTT